MPYWRPLCLSSSRRRQGWQPAISPEGISLKSNERKPSIPLSLLSFESIEKLLYTCFSYLFYFFYFLTFGSFNCVLKCADGGSRTHRRFSSQAQPPSIYTSRYVVQSIFYKDSDRLCALPSKKSVVSFPLAVCCLSISFGLTWRSHVVIKIADISSPLSYFIGSNGWLVVANRGGYGRLA